jgi:hypothetical protein
MGIPWVPWEFPSFAHLYLKLAVFFYISILDPLRKSDYSRGCIMKTILNIINVRSNINYFSHQIYLQIFHVRSSRTIMMSIKTLIDYDPRTRTIIYYIYSQITTPI